MTTIVGAGLSGLIAAHAFPNATVVERQEKPQQMHNALLRFRTEAVSALTGIPFRSVQVRKALWSGGRLTGPTIALANQYSRKVIGRIHNNRSIWNLDTVERFIAPPDFYAQLVENVRGRIEWGTAVEFDCWKEPSKHGPLVNTAPLPIVLKSLGIGTELRFKRSPIRVQRFRVPNCDCFQTVYFPDGGTPLYRASITGDLLIVESINDDSREPTDYSAIVSDAFGLTDFSFIDEVDQKYGKIAAVENETARRSLLFRLTHEHGIYSLGRFGTWKNVLLDDLIHDIAVIKQLQKGDVYSARLQSI